MTSGGNEISGPADPNANPADPKRPADEHRPDATRVFPTLGAEAGQWTPPQSPVDPAAAGWSVPQPPQPAAPQQQWVAGQGPQWQQQPAAQESWTPPEAAQPEPRNQPHESWGQQPQQPAPQQWGQPQSAPQPQAWGEQPAQQQAWGEQQPQQAWGEQQSAAPQAWGQQPSTGAQPVVSPQQAWGQQPTTGSQPALSPQQAWGEQPSQQQAWGSPQAGAQQQWGQQQQGSAQQQQPWGQQSGQQQQPWGQQQPGFGAPAQRPAKSRGGSGTLKWIIGGVVALVVIAAIVGGVLAATASKTLDQKAAQDGISRVLTDKYSIQGVGSVSCPSSITVKSGSTFTCQVSINGDQKNVTAKFTDDNGTYEVGQPQ